MSTAISVVINGAPRLVDGDVTVAVALLNAGVTAFRSDLTGTPRAPLCAMGTCHECRVTIDGIANVRACMILVRDGMCIDSAA